MNRTTKLATIGLMLGCTVVGIGHGYVMHLESRLESARVECVAEGERDAAVTGSYSALAAKYGGKLQCDPISMQQGGAETHPPGAQGRLLQAHQYLESWRFWPNIIGGLFALLFVLPWLWYFILHRIGELRHAIIGK